MATPVYTLDIPRGEPQRLAIGWLLLAVGALVMGGVLTILIVLSRTPGIQGIIPGADFFHTAIVVHVDLTVLVWLLAFAGVFWSLNSTVRGIAWGWAALLISITGAGIFTLAPFIGADNPVMNNYVPVLQDNVFLIGLAMFGLGITALVIRGLSCSRPIGNITSGSGTLRFGLYTALLAALIAALSIVGSYTMIPTTLTGHPYYELLFWGGGHVLQFTHTQLMVVAWLWLATASGAAPRVTPHWALIFLAIGFFPVLVTPVIYIVYAIDSAGHVSAFTRLMEYGGGLAALPLGLAVVMGIIGNRHAAASRTPERAALIYSLALFAAGGLIGFLIRGINVTIPAHYHGSIVGVTLAFMGMTYYLLPRLGFQRPNIRLARIQPAIYGWGQLLHVLGLAWSGGYGVLRKTAGKTQGLDHIQEIAGMVVMGLGGFIAIIGGLLFLVITIKALCNRSISPLPET